LPDQLSAAPGKRNRCLRPTFVTAVSPHLLARLPDDAPCAFMRCWRRSWWARSNWKALDGALDRARDVMWWRW
jgi:predicted alpha/beta hydrolase